MSGRVSPWPAGAPCWVDLTTTDPAAARAAYADALGWSYGPADDSPADDSPADDSPADDGAAGEADGYGGYAICLRDGAAVAAIGPAQPEAPATWTLYLASDDVDATAEAVRAAGGEVLLGPGDVGTLGRMLLAVDPTGAPFGVWQAGSRVGTELVNQPGGLIWEDLRSPDPEAARAFYAAVFGYRYQEVPDAGDAYRTFAGPDGIPLGGIGPLFGTDRASWLVYFAMPDPDASLAAMRRAGGVVVRPPTETPWGRLVTIRDPQGAEFAVMGTVGQEAPDRSG